ncbi:ATP-binding protein [Flavobacterium sp. RSSA_27]|uniref:tetratricopeptide repeat-containing sensor histidine kinase n=1 Tax=Flavobacterium sp. RSSA_27 TaxID=3447667 RepID=UPI003F3C1A80
MLFYSKTSKFFFQYNAILQLLALLLVLFTTTCIAQEKKMSKKETLNLINTAIVEMNDEYYENSLIHSRTALEHATLLKANDLIALCYNTIGGNFDGLLEYEKALFYYKKGLIYADKTNKSILKYFLHNNLGNIYFFDEKDLEKGIYHYKKAIAYSAQSKDTSKMILTKINMAWAYFDIQKFDDGFPHLKFANENFEKHGDSSLLPLTNMLNAMYYSTKKDPKKATSFFENAIKHGIEQDEITDLSYAHFEYSKFLKKVGNYKKAYYHLEQYNTLTEKINIEEKLKKANVAGINLELDEYKREINKISNTIKSKENYWSIQQSRNKKIVVLIITLSLLIFMIFYTFSKNEKLKQTNHLREIQTKIQQNIINATIDGQESERKKIAAFLHDNISALLTSAGMHLNVYSTSSQNQSDELLKTKYILEEAHHKVRDLSHDLIPAVLVRFGLVYALDDLCEKNSNSKITFNYSTNIEKQERLNELFEMKIYFIISELLNNILKHSKANWAKLETIIHENQLMITVEDNGKGFDNLEQNSIDGYGLNRIKARINNMKGEFLIKSQKNQGTTIKLIVPIA